MSFSITSLTLLSKVWALYDRSRKILVFLLVTAALEIAISIVLIVITVLHASGKHGLYLNFHARY